MAEDRTLSIEPFFGGFILETLTVGMYGESRNAIREYIQNGFDSIQRAIRDLKSLAPGTGLIEIEMAEDFKSLRIRDNGAGLSTKLAVEALTSIGASGKDYSSDAGFRGIGRLAGIVFSDEVSFRTKAAGEAEQTTVTFSAATMRELMSPSKGSTLSAEMLLKKCVKAMISDAVASDPAFFEVTLVGFTDAPEECTSVHAMEDFVAQVAPVPYAADFPFQGQIHAYAKAARIPIDEVKVSVRVDDGEPTMITKLYGDGFDVDEEGGRAELTECETLKSDHNFWWAWVGKKSVSGSYVDGRIRGLRVRSKNIQIDGTDVIREIFQKHAKSYVRFPDWYVGEVFIDASALVPNARRDGFEETANWKVVRQELATVCKELGRQAYELSNKGQLTVANLTDKVADARERLESLRRTDFRNTDRTIALSADVTKLQQRVARASKNAEPSVLSSLQAIGSELVDIKTEAVRKVAPPAPVVDTEAIEQAARDGLIRELRTLFETNLGPPCLVIVRNLLREEYGEVD